ncbi:ExbD/TolR family protein [Mucilaginibacter sp.]|uniref:ExbD/TolR family protein n=1 Tax=Mucilaginibacter sp. TaxID=1882438 RepID=UPI003D0F764F
MPRVKVARKSTHIDMTAMCDVAFLLLTFFILTAKPRVDDPVKAEVPSSSKEKIVPETNLGLITVGGNNQIFYSVSGSDVRSEALKAMGDKYKQSFTPEEIVKFSNTEVFGVPMAQLKSFLNMSDDEKKAYKQPGIPADTTNNNELSNWILTSRKANKALHDKDLDIAIKGDKKEQYPVIHEVIEVLGKQKLFKFSLITDLKAAPKK